MSLSNASESDVLDVVLEGTDPAWRAGATGYLALVTGASVDEANPLANECTYTGYARIAQTKATARRRLRAAPRCRPAPAAWRRHPAR